MLASGASHTTSRSQRFDPKANITWHVPLLYLMPCIMMQITPCGANVRQLLVMAEQVANMCTMVHMFVN